MSNENQEVAITDKDTDLMHSMYAKLLADHHELREEYRIVVKNMIQVCVSLGMLPYKEGDNVVKKIMKEAKTIIGEMTFNPKAVGKRFAFLEAEFFPLILKYQADGTVNKYLDHE